MRLIEYQLKHFAELDGEVLNVGGGVSNSLSLIETTQICQEITGKSTQIDSCLEERSGDIPIFITDSAKVINKTGWQPIITPEKSLENIYQWISDNEAILKAILS